jgi:hypothetical protein
MGSIKIILKAAWIVSIAVCAICVALDMTMGKTPGVQIYATASAAFCLTTGLYFVAESFSEKGLGILDPRNFFSLLWLALGVVTLSAAGFLPESFRLWGGGVFLVGFALMVIGFFVVGHFAAKEARKNEPASTVPPPANAVPRPADKGGMSLQGLAFLLMVAGAFALVFSLKCLVFGPPAYSVVAHFIGPVLIVASYLIDRNAIPEMLKQALNQPKPPPADGE